MSVIETMSRDEAMRFTIDYVLDDSTNFKGTQIQLFSRVRELMNTNFHHHISGLTRSEFMTLFQDAIQDMGITFLVSEDDIQTRSGCRLCRQTIYLIIDNVADEHHTVRFRIIMSNIKPDGIIIRSKRLGLHHEQANEYLDIVNSIYRVKFGRSNLGVLSEVAITFDSIFKII